MIPTHVPLGYHSPRTLMFGYLAADPLAKSVWLEAVYTDFRISERSHVEASGQGETYWRSLFLAKILDRIVAWEKLE